MGFFDRLFRRSSERDGDDAPAAPPEQPPEWAAFFRTGERYDRFDAALRSYFNQRGRRALVVDGNLRVTSAPGPARPKSSEADEHSFGLGNLAQVCALEPEEQWPGIIARHFDTMDQLFAAGHDFSNLPFEDVRCRLGIRLWDMSADTIRDKTLWREDIPGLASVLCLDEPKAIVTLRPESVEQWGASADELFAHALRNLPDLAPVIHQRHEMPEGHTLHEFLGESLFSCAWALRLDQWPELDGPHGLFFSVPNRHRVLVLEFQSSKSIIPVGHLMNMTHGLEQEGPGSISSRVFWKRNGEIIEIPYTADQEGLHVSPPDQFIEYLNTLAQSEDL